FEERTGIPCEASLPDLMPELDPEVATALYRICQEAMTNVHRHATASRVAVRLQMESSSITLQVEDDGRGFEPAVAGSPQALGLHQILRESFRDAKFGDASSAAEALELAGQERWDIALIDLNLKGRDGLSLLEEIKRVYPALPALVLSAYPEEEFAVRCLRLGASGYVT